MTSTKLIMLCAAASLTGICTFATTASAAPRPVVVTAPSEVLTARISYADLNLASASGERKLNGRVDVGVHNLCMDATGGYDVFGGSKMEPCTRSAWNQARPQIRLAVQRAREIALTGTSTIAAVAITIAPLK